MSSLIYNSNPNFSIVLPGPCQAKCDFCFWTPKETDKNWLKKLEFILDTLPECFTQISITGGEPTLSPFFEETLGLISSRKKKYKKVVLSTNGYDLPSYQDLDDCIDYLNISRHAIKDIDNYKIFRTKHIPNTKELKDYLHFLGDTKGNIITINSVVKELSIHELYNWIFFLQNISCDNIAFRKEHGNLKPLAVEKYLDMFGTNKTEGSCPVCRTVGYRLHGFNITLKYSVLEPKDKIKEIYELVYHADGKLTKDWEAKEEVELIRE